MTTFRTGTHRPDDDTLLSILAGLADGSRPGHNACESCADVMARAREVLLALYEAPEPRVLWRGRPQWNLGLGYLIRLPELRAPMNLVVLEDVCHEEGDDSDGE